MLWTTSEVRVCVSFHFVKKQKQLIFNYNIPTSLFFFHSPAHPASRSAFSVALTNQPGWFCLGPFNDDKVVTYKDEFINLGNGYNVDSGVFTVPRSGVYSIALTVYSGGTIPPNALTVCASLQVNGVVVARPKEQNTQDKEDSATVVLSLHLNAGDQVAVVLPAGCSLCDNKSHYNTFTGFLLYATT